MMLRNMQRVLFGIDTGLVLHGLATKPWLWQENAVLLRGCPSPANPWLVRNWPAAAVLPEIRQLLFGLMTRVSGEHLGRVKIVRLAPGESSYMVDPKDAWPAEAVEHKPWQYYQHYAVVLQAEPGVRLRMAEEQTSLAAGELWWVDAELPRELHNDSANDLLLMYVEAAVPDYTYAP
jgi:hypothetical protein